MVVEKKVLLVLLLGLIFEAALLILWGHEHVLPFKVFSLPIRWYGVCMAAAVGVSIWLFLSAAERQNIPTGKAEQLSLWLLTFGFIGARLYHVLTEFSFYVHNPGQIIAVWHGGLSILGALLGGLFALWLLVKKYYPAEQKPMFLIFVDLLALPVLVGQIIGRTGNWFNSEVLGSVSNVPWAVAVSFSEQTYIPWFFYEQIGLFLIAIVLVFFSKKLPSGGVCWLYLALYTIERLVLEPFRADAPHVWGIKQNMLVPAIGLLALLCIGFWHHQSQLYAQSSPD